MKIANRHYTTAHSISYVDRVRGCLYGGAIGDALGYEIEFDRWVEIQKRFGPQGIREPVANRGKFVISDDTQMTLFGVEAIIASAGHILDHDVVIERIRQAYLDWHSTQEPWSDWKPVGQLWREPVMRHQRAPGSTSLAACRSGANGSPEHPLNDSKGCGGVMRVAPLGLAQDWSPAEAFEIGVRAAALTHGHPRAFLSAGTMAFIIRRLLDGTELHQAAAEAIELARQWGGHEGLVGLLRAVLLSPGQNDLIRLGALGEGWTGDEALAIGLAAALAGRHFTDVIALAANHDGDSDSTASIAGQLYGAQHGVGALPADWIEKLDVINPMSELIHRFGTPIAF